MDVEDDTTEAGSDAVVANNKRPRKVRRKVKITLPTNLPTASQLLGANIATPKIYWDRSHYDSPASQLEALTTSSTLYIGNLAFSTRSSHVRALFSQIGPLKLVVMGLDRYKKTPCGFAFVEYRYQKDANLAISCLTGVKLDGRIIRVERDAGYKPGRQFGRGKSGGQVRDDRRSSTRDPDRMAQGGGGGRGCMGGPLGTSRGGSKFQQQKSWKPPSASEGGAVSTSQSETGGEENMDTAGAS